MKYFIKMTIVLPGFGGVFWLELIGGMQLGVHRVLPRMALVSLDFFGCITETNK